MTIVAYFQSRSRQISHLPTEEEGRKYPVFLRVAGNYLPTCEEGKYPIFPWRSRQIFHFPTEQADYYPIFSREKQASVIGI